MKKTILPHNLFENTSAQETEKASKENPLKDTGSDRSETAPKPPALPHEYLTLSDKSYLLRMPAALHSRISDLV